MTKKNEEIKQLETVSRQVAEGTAPVNRVLEYGDYTIVRFDEAQLVIIRPTEAAFKAGKVLDDRLKGKWLTISEAIKAIDHTEGGKPHAPKQRVIFDIRGGGFMDADTEAYYQRYN